jgi:hypothetical protein
MAIFNNLLVHLLVLTYSYGLVSSKAGGSVLKKGVLCNRERPFSVTSFAKAKLRASAKKSPKKL